MQPHHLLQISWLWQCWQPNDVNRKASRGNAAGPQLSLYLLAVAAVWWSPASAARISTSSLIGNGSAKRACWHMASCLTLKYQTSCITFFSSSHLKCIPHCKIISHLIFYEDSYYVNTQWTACPFDRLLSLCEDLRKRQLLQNFHLVQRSSYWSCCCVFKGTPRIPSENLWDTLSAAWQDRKMRKCTLTNSFLPLRSASSQLIDTLPGTRFHYGVSSIALSNESLICTLQETLLYHSWPTWMGTYWFPLPQSGSMPVYQTCCTFWPTLGIL